MARLPNASGLTGDLDTAASVGLRTRQSRVVGVAFTVPELLIMTAWAEYHGLRLVIELDTCVDGAVYEEVAAFYSPGLLLRRWSLWRSPDALVMERLDGPVNTAHCIGEILDRMIPVAL